MIHKNFLSRQKHDEIDPNEVIPISFSMQKVLHAKYHNKHENDQEKLFC